ncbi:DUF7681 family protein [Bradyrhizobium oligotrophicum S58]
MNAMTEMPRYQSHKQVWALKIAAIEIHQDKSATIAPVDAGYVSFTTKPGWAERWSGSEEDLGYFVQYQDGFASWSPTKAFEEGYTAEQRPKVHEGLPVAGYKPQNADAVHEVNENKKLEEQVLRQIDTLEKDDHLKVDQRWLAIGRTAIEQGFMAINRAVFKPGRVALPGDGE